MKRSDGRTGLALVFGKKGAGILGRKGLGPKIPRQSVGFFYPLFDGGPWYLFYLLNILLAESQDVRSSMTMLNARTGQRV